MTTSPAKRRSAARSLPLAEIERMMRARAYIRPLPAVPPLHRMGRQREPGRDDQDETAEA